MSTAAKKKSSVHQVASKKDASAVDINKSIMDTAAEQEKAAQLKKEAMMRQFEDRTPGGLARAQKHSEFMIAFTAQIETLIERHSNRYKRALTEVSKLDTVYDAEIQHEFDRMVENAHLVTGHDVEAFHRQIIDNTQIQLASVDTIEAKLLANEKKFARDIHQALKTWQEDLQRTAHLREEEIQDLVQEKAVELNKCLTQNQSMILRYCLALRVEKVLKSQRERITKFEHFRLNKWRPIRGEYLEKTFMDFLYTLRADKVGSIWEEATETYRQCTIQQMAIADRLSNTPATELTEERVHEAQEKITSLWQKLDQEQLNSLSSLFMFDKELINVKTEKYKELNAQAKECDYEISKQLKTAMQDLQSDPDTVSCRNKIEQLKAVSKSNRKLLCLYCKYLAAGLTMWGQYNQQTKKADENFKTTLQEIQNVHQSDIDSIEKDIEHSIASMTNVVDTLPFLEEHLNYCKELLSNLESSYQGEFQEYSDCVENHKKKHLDVAATFNAELLKFLKPALDKNITQEPSIVKQKIETVQISTNKKIAFAGGSRSDNEDGQEKNAVKKMVRKEYQMPDKGLGLKFIITPATLHEYRNKTFKVWGDGFAAFSKQVYADLELETTHLLAQSRNKMHQRFYDDEPRYLRIEQDIYEPRKLQLIKLRDDRLREAENLARRIVDSRLNFHQSYLKTETIMRSFLDFVKTSVLSMKGSTSINYKELSDYKTSYLKQKTDCTSQIKSILGEAEAQFKEFLEHVHEIREKAAAKGIRKVATSQGRKTPSQRRKLSITQTDENAKKELWERASGFLTEIIADSSELVNTLMSIPERKFMQSYQPKIDHMQHEMEVSCHEFDDLVGSITDDIEFSDKTATRIAEASKKIEFEMQNFHVLAGKTQKQLYDAAECIEKINLHCGRLKLRFDPDTKKPMELLFISLRELEKLRAMLSQLAFTMNLEVGDDQRYTRIVASFPAWVERLHYSMKDAKLYILDTTDINDRVSPARSKWKFSDACKEETDKTRKLLLELASQFYEKKNSPRDTQLHVRLKIPLTFEDFAQDLNQRLSVLSDKRNQLTETSSKEFNANLERTLNNELPLLLPGTFDIMRQVVLYAINAMNNETTALLKKTQTENSSTRNEIMRLLSPRLGHPNKSEELKNLNQKQVERSQNYQKALQAIRTNLKNDLFDILTNFVLPAQLYLVEGIFYVANGLPLSKDIPMISYNGADLSTVKSILPDGYARIENPISGYQLPVLQALISGRDETLKSIFTQIGTVFAHISESVETAVGSEDRWIQSWHTAVENVRSIY